MRYRAASVLGTLLSFVVAVGVSPSAAEESRPDIDTFARNPPHGRAFPSSGRARPAPRRGHEDLAKPGGRDRLAVPHCAPRTGGQKPCACLSSPGAGARRQQNDSLAVGELLGPGRGHAVAIASIEAAERSARGGEAARLSLADPAGSAPPWPGARTGGGSRDRPLSARHAHARQARAHAPALRRPGVFRPSPGHLHPRRRRRAVAEGLGRSRGGAHPRRRACPLFVHALSPAAFP